MLLWSVGARALFNTERDFKIETARTAGGEEEQFGKLLKIY